MKLSLKKLHPQIYKAGFLLFLSIIGFSVYGNQRHVATTGNDSNPGTLALPWKTVRYAGAHAVAGDTVFIHEGTYYDMLIVRNSGTEGNPIVFTRFESDEVIIDATGKEIYSEMNWLAGLRRWHGAVDMYNVKWIEIRGLRIQNMTLGNGIYFQRAEHITIENNIIDNTFTSGIGTWVDNVQPDPNDNTKQLYPPDTTVWRFSKFIYVRNNEVTRAVNGGWSEAISFEGVEHFEIVGNYVHDNFHGNPANFWGGGGENIDCKTGTRYGIIANNIVHGNRRIGIYIDAWNAHVHDIDIYNNICYDLRLGAAIAISNEDGGKVSNINIFNNIMYNTKDGIIIPNPNKRPYEPVDNIKIYNNTAVHCGYDTEYPGGYGFKMDNPDATNIDVYNNVFNNNETEQMNVNSAVPTTEYVLDNNIIFPYKGASGNSRKGTNPIELDPKFIDATSYNFYLQATSPAIDAANSSLVSDFDYINSMRPFGVGYDIGAFEYIGEVAPPTAPSGLTAVAISSTQINLSWSDNSDNEMGFDIYRSIGTNDNFSFHKTVLANVYSFSDKDLDFGTSYFYKVSAKNIGGISAFSNEDSATTKLQQSGNTFNQQGSNGIVSMEAENYTENITGEGSFVSVKWKGFSDELASNGTYMMVPNSNNLNGGSSPDSPSLNFDIDFSRSGNHYIWLRVATPTQDDNSVSVFFNDILIEEWHLPLVSWAWVKCSKTLDASIGVNRFTIRMREDGTKVDKIVLTTSSTYTPTGTGPEETLPDTITSLMNIQNAGSVQLYPNPVTNGQFIIHFGEKVSGQCVIDIMDMSGRIVYSTIANMQSEMPVLIESELTNGMYIVNINNGCVVKNKKLIIK